MSEFQPKIVDYRSAWDDKGIHTGDILGDGVVLRPNKSTVKDMYSPTVCGSYVSNANTNCSRGDCARTDCPLLTKK